MDSTLRLKQLNQPELSGFISTVVSSLPKQNISGDITPSGSGIYGLGSTTHYYGNIYSNRVTLPSGSGIYFGNTSFSAFSSGGMGVIKIDNYTITSSGNYISIQGPSGDRGPTGVTGATGATGAGITGIQYNPSTYALTFYLSNGTNTGVTVPPLSGATGVSVTGFFQSGYYIFPQFDHFKGTGAKVLLPQGPIGAPGSISLYYQSGGSSFSEIDFPSVVNVEDYYDTSSFPPISMMRGMNYTLNFSGLRTHTITASDYAILTGIFSGSTNLVPTVGTDINYYEDPTNGTGFWRMAFFDEATPTGIYRPTLLTDYPLSAIKNDEVYGNSLTYNAYHSDITFNTRFTAQNNYKYGFVIYTIGEAGEEILNSNSFTSYSLFSIGCAIVCGNAFCSSGVGPAGLTGPSGSIGPQGIPGPIGESIEGPQGVGLNSFEQRSTGTNSYELRFLLTNGDYTDWFPLPSGGPSGVSGAQGAPGLLVNHFRGEYSNGVIYSPDDSVSYSGSSYIYIGLSPNIGFDPSNTSYWQVLALKGDKGDIGPSGASGINAISDKYSSSYFVISGKPTGAGTYANNITGLTVNGAALSGTNAKFTTGDIVSFTNSGITGYSYSPYQKIVIASNSYTGTYFNATIISYNSPSGIISFQVDTGNFSGVQGTTIDTTVNPKKIFWYNYLNTTMNIANGVGAKGDSGQPSLLRNGVYYLKMGSSTLFNISGYDVLNLTITGEYTPGCDPVSIDFDLTKFDTGKSLIVKVRNSGIADGNLEPPIFYFTGAATGIRWPNRTYTRPNDQEAYIYTIIRFPDEDGRTSCFGTYSNPYYYNDL